MLNLISLQDDYIFYSRFKEQLCSAVRRPKNLWKIIDSGMASKRFQASSEGITKLTIFRIGAYCAKNSVMPWQY